MMILSFGRRSERSDQQVRVWRQVIDGAFGHGYARARSRLANRIAILTLGAALLFTGGCGTAPTRPASLKIEPEAQKLQAGDVIKITFPGAQTLDTTQQIRRDGKINLSMVGEVQADDKTPAELEKLLVQLYSSQIVSKELTVTVVSSSFAVFVTGAVLRPGKIQPDRPITAFEAIMEAGGFDYAKANTKAVVVIRTENGRSKNFNVNLKKVLDGKETEAFYLKSHDVVYVPEKFSWF